MDMTPAERAQWITDHAHELLATLKFVYTTLEELCGEADLPLNTLAHLVYMRDEARHMIEKAEGRS